MILAPVLPVATGLLTASLAGATHPLLGTLVGTSAVLSGYAILFWKTGVYKRLAEL